MSKSFHSGGSSISLGSLTKAGLNKSKSNISSGPKLVRGASQNLYGLVTLGETAGVNVDDFEAEVVSPKRRISRVDHEHTVHHGVSGEELLTQKTRKPNMEGLEKFTQLNQIKDVQKKGMDKNVLQRVIIDDERNVTACLTLPSTFVFFVIFMILFQQHYTTSYIHLQETYLRTRVTDPANSVGDINSLWDWMSNVFIPFIYSTDQSLGQNRLTTTTGAEFQQQIGGILFRSQRSRSMTCEDVATDSGLSFKCHPQDTVNVSGHHFQQDPRLGNLGGWIITDGSRRLQPSERMHPERSADPSNWFEALLSHISRWFPHQATYVRGDSGNTMLDEETAARKSSSRERYAWLERRKSIASTFNQFSRKWKHHNGKSKSKGWRPLGLGPLHRVFDPMKSMRDSTGRHILFPKSDVRRLKATRPEFGMLGWIPYPFVKDDVWEYVVPMSTPKDQVDGLIQQWKQGHLIDRSNLFFGVEVLLKNKAIGEGVLTHVFINFVFSRGGHIYVETIFQSLVLADDKFVLFFGFAWLLLLTFNSIAIPARCGLAYRRRKLKEHSFTFWNLLEWLVVFYGWIVVAIFMAERFGTRKFNNQYSDYREERINADPSALQNLDIAWFDKIHKNVYNTGTTDVYLLVIVANFHLFLVLRYFVASRGQPRLAIVVNTFRDASVDLLHLLVVFGIIFFAYIVSGHILFGRRMAQFATLEGAAAYTIQIVLNREFDFQTLSEQDFFTALLWVFTFVILVVIIMINIVLAMIFDIYGDVRAHISAGDSLVDTFRTVFQRTKMHRVWVPNGELLIATKSLPHEKITLKMVQDAIPGIPKAQLNYIFDKSKQKFDTIIMRGNKNAMIEALTAVLLGIVQARDGVAYMKGQLVARERFKSRTASQSTSAPRSMDSLEPTAPPNLPPNLPSDPLLKTALEGIRESSRQSQETESSLYASMEENLQATGGAPKWLHEGLVPLLKAQQTHMDEVSKKLHGVEKWLQQRGVGILTAESDYPKPSDPRQEDGRIIQPWQEDKITVHSGRVQSVVKAPPPSCSSVGKGNRIVGGTGIVYL